MAATRSCHKFSNLKSCKFDSSGGQKFKIGFIGSCVEVCGGSGEKPIPCSTASSGWPSQASVLGSHLLLFPPRAVLHHLLPHARISDACPTASTLKGSLRCHWVTWTHQDNRSCYDPYSCVLSPFCHVRNSYGFQVLGQGHYSLDHRWENTVLWLQAQSCPWALPASTQIVLIACSKAGEWRRGAEFTESVMCLSEYVCSCVCMYLWEAVCRCGECLNMSIWPWKHRCVCACVLDTGVRNSQIFENLNRMWWWKHSWTGDLNNNQCSAETPPFQFMSLILDSVQKHPHSQVPRVKTRAWGLCPWQSAKPVSCPFAALALCWLSACRFSALGPALPLLQKPSPVLATQLGSV